MKIFQDKQVSVHMMRDHTGTHIRVYTLSNGREMHLTDVPGFNKLSFTHVLARAEISLPAVVDIPPEIRPEVDDAY